MSTTQTTTVGAMVADAKARIENLSPAAVAKEVEAGDALLVDLREPEERAQNGTIKGSVAAPRGMIEFYADPTTPYHRPEFQFDRRIILHCASGGRSALATDTLTKLGYTRVGHLDGGLKAWKEQGFPVQSV
ncbi:MAG: rhodanese-like domain-containing protein [Terriglobia bacterium]